MKTDKVTPIDLWGGTTAKKFEIDTKKRSSGDYLSVIQFYGQRFSAHDDEETKSRHKVAAVALEQLLGIFLSQWNVYKTPTTSNTVQTSSLLALASSISTDLTTKEKKIKQIETKIKGNALCRTPCAVEQVGHSPPKSKSGQIVGKKEKKMFFHQICLLRAR